jgi:hypothetical protein
LRPPAREAEATDRQRVPRTIPVRVHKPSIGAQIW